MKVQVAVLLDSLLKILNSYPLRDDGPTQPEDDQPGLGRLYLFSQLAR